MMPDAEVQREKPNNECKISTKFRSQSEAVGIYNEIYFSLKGNTN